MCFLKHQDVISQCSKVSNKLLSFFWVICFFEATAIEGGNFNCMMLINHINVDELEDGLSIQVVCHRFLHSGAG